MTALLAVKRSGPSRTKVRLGGAFLVALGALASSHARAATIAATLDSAEPVTAATAVLQEETSTGVHPKPFAGKLEGDKLTFADLPPGKYDLHLETASGRIWGWDAGVPASDYEEEQPLADAAKKTLFQKMARDNVSGFDDYVAVLDIRGNIQNAAILSVHLRTRSFVEGAGENRDTWVWRLNRTQWHDPDEINWQPFQSKPYYALVRERIKKEPAWRAQRYLLARHLGGIALKDGEASVDLGIVKMPKVAPGFRAMNPDGSLIEPVVVKGAGASAEFRVSSYSVPAEKEAPATRTGAAEPKKDP